MTSTEFQQLIVNPEHAEASHGADLKDIVEAYPWFAQARVLWLQTLQKSNSVHTSSQLELSSLYVRDKRQLYYFLYPGMKLKEEKLTSHRQGSTSGSYFDMLDAAEAAGGDSQSTLRKIAEQLKLSRARMHADKTVQDERATMTDKERSRVVVPVIDYFIQGNPENESTLELKSRQLIREHRYMEAVEILKQLNLINPKKSIYFADQIRFLEKVIVNSYKTR